MVIIKITLCFTTMKAVISQKPVIRVLLVIFAFLLVGHFAALYCKFGLEKPNGFGIVPLFLFDRENNLPTLFSGVQLAIAALLALGIAYHFRAQEPGGSRPWFIVAIVLTYLGIDDMSSIHDHIDLALMARVETTGLIHWPWVIPYAILALGIIVYFIPFFFRLPVATRIVFATSAAMYIFGGIGMEMIGARHAEHAGEEGLRYALFTTIEESLEMLAVTLLIAGLIHYINNHAKTLSVTFLPESSEKNALPTEP